VNPIRSVLGCLPGRESSLKSNPYDFTKPVSKQSSLLGRRAVLARVRSYVEAVPPQSVAVSGPFKIGKSSLLRVLSTKTMLERPENYVCFYKDFAEDVEPSADALAHDFVCAVQGSGVDVQPTRTIGGLTPFEDAVAALKRAGKNALILFDNFEFALRSPRFSLADFGFLRYLSNNYQNISYVTATRRNLAMEFAEIGTLQGSPFPNIFHGLKLKPFTYEEARELICVPSSAAGVAFEGLAHELYVLAGPLPYPLKVVCWHAFEMAKTGKSTDEMTRGVCKRLATRKTVGSSQQSVLDYLCQEGYGIATGGRTVRLPRVFEEYVVQQMKHGSTTGGTTWWRKVQSSLGLF